MKKILHLVLLVTLSFSITSWGDTPPQKTVPIDSIAAIIDEEIILTSELETELKHVKRRIKENNIEAPQQSILIKQVLESLVLRQLQISEANKRGITVDNITLNETIRKLASQNKLSLDEFRRKLITDNIDYETYRKELHKDILINRLLQGAVYNRIAISKREVEDFIKAQRFQNNKILYLLSHIQLSIPEAADSNTVETIENRAKDIYKRLSDGEDFAKMAIAESKGQSALNGGDIGWLRMSEMPALFTDPVQTLKINEASKPIRAPRGFHIIKLRDTKGIARRIVKQVHARHILIKTDTLDTDKKVRKQLSGIRQQIIDGADFSKLAIKLSDDPGSSSDGGDMDWNSPSIFVGQFSKVINTLPKNKISEPFKTQYGWHIAEVLGWRDYDKTNEYAFNDAYQKLHERKAKIEEDLWLRRLRDDAYVELRIE